MTKRLTDDDRRYRELTEAQFQRQVTDLAELLGWRWLHIRHAAAMTRQGTVGRYITPISGSLGKGWPDLVLIRERDRRLLFVELKREVGATRPEQVEVLDFLRRTLDYHAIGQVPLIDSASVEVYLWRPSMIDNIAAILQ